MKTIDLKDLQNVIGGQCANCRGPGCPGCGGDEGGGGTTGTTNPLQTKGRGFPGASTSFGF